MIDKTINDLKGIMKWYSMPEEHCNVIYRAIGMLQQYELYQSQADEMIREDIELHEGRRQV